MSSNALKNIPLPTLDHPFGIRLWPIFDKIWMQLRGQHAKDWHFVSGVTPMSTMMETGSALVLYYVIILGGREVMRKREPLKLNGLFMLHNFYLTAISAGLLALFVEQLLPTVWRHGLFYSICSTSGGWTPQLVVLYYLNYVTKYIELIDTLFLVLKKKPLTFLHTYHHGATALLCYTQLVGLTPISWVPITLNLMVHVVMYWYYFQSARGVRIWWKEWITRLQIMQFVIDLGFVYFASYTYFTSTYFPFMPHQGHCAGEEFAAFAGMGILSSYLLLFISFYLTTYKKDAKGRGKRDNTAKKATIDMAKTEVPWIKAMAESVANGSAQGASKTSGRPEGMSTRSRKA